MARILYIARMPYGAMGEAAMNNYALHVPLAHTVAFAAPPPELGETGLKLPDNVQGFTLPRGPAASRRIALFDAIRAFRPDIVHLVQSPWCFDDLMGLQPVFEGVRWVLDFRSPHVGAPDAPALKRFQAMHVHTDLILTHSLLTLRTNIRRPLRRALEIPPGVNFDAIPATATPQDPPQRFLYVGSIAKTRRIGDLITMFNSFTNTPAGAEATLDLIGSGSAVELVQRRIAESEAKCSIQVLPPLPQLDLWMKMQDYDIGLAYVPYGIFERAPSLKSLEFAAAGLPVIASDTPGHRDSVRRFGFRFTLFDNTPTGFAAAVAGLHPDVEDQRTNRAAARALDWSAIIRDRLLPAYRRLLP